MHVICNIYIQYDMKVRRSACREPLFSLDPVDPQNLEKTPQMKRYEPAWLAGTSVGNIMFQAPSGTSKNI